MTSFFVVRLHQAYRSEALTSSLVTTLALVGSTQTSSGTACWHLLIHCANTRNASGTRRFSSTSVCRMGPMCMSMLAVIWECCVREAYF